MRRVRLALLVLLPVAASALGAQQPYRDPPAPIAQILDAPPTPIVSLSPDRRWLLLVAPENLPPIGEVAAPELRLAGVRLNPRTSGPSRGATYRGLELRPLAGGAARPIRLPPGTRLGFPLWAPSGQRLAFTVTSGDGLRIWVAEVRTGVARQLSARRLNATLGPPCTWLGGDTELLCRFVPADRGAPPADLVPAGPAVQEAGGRVAPNRTYQDLLRNAADEALFDHHARSQVARVSLAGVVTPVGRPGVYSLVQPSPDGRYLAVQQVRHPYSYVVPVSRFPAALMLWSREGRLIRTLAELPLQDAVPSDFDAVPTGPRAVRWRGGAPATLAWAEALDGGDPRREAARRDRVLTLRAPFTGEPATLADLDYRFSGLAWFRDGRVLVEESWWKSRRTRTWLVQPAAASRLVFDRSSEDRYLDPGAVVLAPTPLGPVVQEAADGSIYLDGQGASAEGDRPFLDRMDLTAGTTLRLWRSEAPAYEAFIAALDPEGARFITRRESVDDPPNYFIRDRADGSLRPLTSFADPAPQFAGLKGELVTYTRADGVQLSARLFLPPGYTSAQGPLPFFFWAYPQEFKSADAAAQVSGSPYRFRRPSGADPLFLLTQGYGVLDGPAMPIVGEGDQEPNDSYVEQLVASAAAAVDKVVAMGVADRDRIGVGGHSYGAFMTANLLAHSDLFRAGIARSGAYNRSLTPFGFQAEERTYWQARETYDRMSPFTHADRIKEPLLLIHGEADNNSGTFPIQSERLFAALKGTGGTTRLVMLPAESHGYRARESVGHVLWEMTAWLDRWVKPARPSAGAGT